MYIFSKFMKLLKKKLKDYAKKRLLKILHKSNSYHSFRLEKLWIPIFSFIYVLMVNILSYAFFHDKEKFAFSTTKQTGTKAQVCSNTRVPTQVNMSQHESTRAWHESTRIYTSLTQVNTNQHKSKSVLDELTWIDRSTTWA